MVGAGERRGWSCENIGSGGGGDQFLIGCQVCLCVHLKDEYLTVTVGKKYSKVTSNHGTLVS